MLYELHTKKGNKIESWVNKGEKGSRFEVGKNPFWRKEHKFYLSIGNGKKKPRNIDTIYTNEGLKIMERSRLLKEKTEKKETHCQMH